MKVKDLIREDIDIDVCDDYDERCWIAKSGAYRLTDAGEQRFRDALDVEVWMTGSKVPLAVLECPTDKEAQACKELFFSLAGYCSDDDYRRWFKEV